MLNAMRERMRAYLSANSVGVLSLSGQQGTWAMPVRYRAENLDVDCLVPRWADVAYHVEQCRAVLLVIPCNFPPSPQASLCWLQYMGNAWPVAKPNWGGLLPRMASEAPADDLFLVLRVIPERIDLIDESQGWGARETLEIDDA